jgi:hypothetical protein
MPVILPFGPAAAAVALETRAVARETQVTAWSSAAGKR